MICLCSNSTACFGMEKGRTGWEEVVEGCRRIVAVNLGFDIKGILFHRFRNSVPSPRTVRPDGLRR